MAKKLLPMLVEASRKTVATYQPIINKQGMGFKNFIPATFGTHAAAIFTAKTGFYLKQTTFDELLRNPKNRSEEHTSELQSQSNLVCRLLLEKKKIQLADILTLNH